MLAAAGFVAGLLVAAGTGATQVGINATIALLVFGRFAVPPGLAAVHGSWVLAGGLFQTGLAVAIRSPRPFRSQRVALASGFDALAGRGREQQAASDHRVRGGCDRPAGHRTAGCRAMTARRPSGSAG